MDCSSPLGGDDEEPVDPGALLDAAGWRAKFPAASSVVFSDVSSATCSPLFSAVISSGAESLQAENIKIKPVPNVATKSLAMLLLITIGSIISFSFGAIGSVSSQFCSSGHGVIGASSGK